MTGAEIRALREGLGVDQTLMAMLLRVERTHLSRMEGGVRPVPAAVADRASLLRYKARDAIGLEHDPRDADRLADAETAFVASLAMKTAHSFEQALRFLQISGFRDALAQACRTYASKERTR